MFKRWRGKAAKRETVCESKRRFGPQACVTLFLLWRNGKTSEELAEAEEISVSYVNKLIKRGRDWFSVREVPKAELLQGPNPRECTPRHHPIKIGDYVECLDCGLGGHDEIDKLQPIDAPKPDPKPPDKPLLAEKGSQKRKKSKPKGPK